MKKLFVAMIALAFTTAAASAQQYTTRPNLYG